MTEARLLASASLLCRLATAILPRPMRDWGHAMEHELASAANGHAAFGFALGCLGCALRMAFAFHLLDPIRSWINAPAGRATLRWQDDLLRQPRRLVIACAVGATSLGIVHMLAAEAPLRHVATNVAALLLALIGLGAIPRLTGGGRLGAGLTSIALGLALLATALFGISVDGAARWISIGGVAVQPSLLFVPTLAICFARTPDPLSAAGVAVAALALGLQPDRALAGSLAAGMALLAMIRTEPSVLIALGAALVGFALALAQHDLSAAVPFVEGRLITSFAVHPLAGLAVFGGAALMLLPAMAGGIHDRENREVYAVFGALWLGVIAGSALGNYPAPLVGYGGSAIIGYVVSLIGLPGRVAGAPRPRNGAGYGAIPRFEDRNVNVRLIST